MKTSSISTSVSSFGSETRGVGAFQSDTLAINYLTDTAADTTRFRVILSTKHVVEAA